MSSPLTRTLLCVLLCVSAMALTPEQDEYFQALEKINFDDVRADIKTMFVTSQSYWPADYGHYGPFFIRLAWHCSGSYRTSDGRGGCGGGRQRFDPERSWQDNTNLNQARKLLRPIKEKYGLGLSWGDLFILTGDTAIEDLGGEVLGFCAGRYDDVDGKQSEALLGPPATCDTPGDCKLPFGTTTIGLIYLNPEGPEGKPIPEESCKQIRDTFGRMSMNDTETVALIGGGHSFGKTHGACADAPGPSPKYDPQNPWAGKCGTGVGVDAWTSGFEGPWTTKPTVFDNEYFQSLVKYVWEVEKGPGGHYQWHIGNSSPPTTPYANGTGQQDLMMLTSDVSLMYDKNYKPIVEQFAGDMKGFSHAFKHAWYKLTTRDVGPHTKCFGKDTPPPQPFQYPLPPSTNNINATLTTAIRNDILFRLRYANPSVLEPDYVTSGDRQGPYYGAMFMKLALQCSNTFRVTDSQGGCNGARIRFSPQADWTENTNMDKVMNILEPIKKKYGSRLTWADLIIFAAQVTLIDAGHNLHVDFCQGRTDALDGSGSENLKPRQFAFNESLAGLRYSQGLLDMSDEETVVLQAMQRSSALLNDTGLRSWTDDSSLISKEYFRVLFFNQWKEYGTGKTKQYKTVQQHGKEIFMLASDIALLEDPSLKKIVQGFALGSSEKFYTAFEKAWVKLVQSDRFFGPVDNYCRTYRPPTPQRHL